VVLAAQRLLVEEATMQSENERQSRPGETKPMATEGEGGEWIRDLNLVGDRKQQTWEKADAGGEYHYTDTVEEGGGVCPS
jgi:hypothetical protein